MYYKFNSAQSNHSLANLSVNKSPRLIMPAMVTAEESSGSQPAHDLSDKPVKFQFPQPGRKMQLLYTDGDTNKVKQAEKVYLKTSEPGKTAVFDSSYVFPVLTEEEMKANEKQKKKMISQLMKRSQRHYFLVPAGTFTYNGRQTSLYPFYIQATEVTNLEYRTFLYDLLIRNRREEFLKAKPDQQQWVKETGSNYFRPMVENYFSNHTYDRYPVVNISREGAEMYCKWLTIETKSAAGSLFNLPR